MNFFDADDIYMKIVDTIFQYFRETLGRIPEDVEDIQDVHNLYENNKSNVGFAFGDDGVITMITRHQFMNTIRDAIRTSRFLDAISGSPFFTGEFDDSFRGDESTEDFILYVVSEGSESEYFPFSEDLKWAMHDDNSVFLFHSAT